MARLAAFATALLFASTAGASTAPLFPLVPGNQWKLVGSGVTRTVTVARSGGALVLRGFPGLPETRVRTVGARIEAREATAWMPFLRLGAAAGTSYRLTFGDAPLWHGVTVTVASRRAVVTDADGHTYRGCVRLTITPPKKVVDAGVEELVFAPGVGLVRVTEQTFAGPRQLLLASGPAPTR